MNNQVAKSIMTTMVMLAIMCLTQCCRTQFANDVNVELWKFDNSMGVLHPDSVDTTGIVQPVEYTEASITFNLARGTNMEKYTEWASGVLTEIRQANGCYKCRFSNNTLDSPQVKWTSWWLRFEHWAVFTEGDQWQLILSKLRTEYAECINVEIWALDHSLSLLPEEQDDQPTKPQPYVGADVEANITFNLTPGINPRKYREWANDAIIKIVKAPGCLCWSSAHNAMDSPRVEWISWWESVDAWAKFTASNDWQTILLKLTEPN
jgi:hypothetical protein